MLCLIAVEHMHTQIGLQAYLLLLKKWSRYDAYTASLKTLVSAGRVLTIRTQGKLAFYTVRGSGSEVQIICAAEYVLPRPG